MDRIRETNLRRYGGPSPANSDNVREKMQQTTLERHGVDNISKLESTKQTKVDKALERYGVENVAQASEVRAKISAYRQNLSPEEAAEINDRGIRTAKKYRDYALPSGKVISIQGYENFALDILVQTIPEDEIVIGKGSVPVIRYSLGERRRLHFPDIFLPKENRIIEVKSTFTFARHKELNEAKMKAAQESGFQYEFWIFDSHGGREVYSFASS